MQAEFQTFIFCDTCKSQKIVYGVSDQLVCFLAPGVDKFWWTQFFQTGWQLGDTNKLLVSSVISDDLLQSMLNE